MSDRRKRDGEESGKEGSARSASAEGARPSTARSLAWVVGGVVGLVGAATTVRDSLDHDHGAGPYLLAAAFLILFLCALDMWSDERTRVRRATRSMRRLTALGDRLEGNVQHLERDRDGWRRMQAVEAAINRRLSEKLGRMQQPQVSGGTGGVASTGPRAQPVFAPPRPTPRHRPSPRHVVRRPPTNQPRLFDQDEVQK